MASNCFGKIFKITTWGESHGKAIGVVIDGCPAGLHLTKEEIQDEIDFRSPGRSPYTSPRQEKDEVEIYSGVWEGRTTGAPISLIFFNLDADSSKYEPIKNLYRPGHANYTYLEKYGLFDYRGGGRASARETVCRVAAGAIAKKILKAFDVYICAYLYEVGGIRGGVSENGNLEALKQKTLSSPIFCPTQEEQTIMTLLDEVKKEGDSIGGIVEVITSNLPAGLGDPVYEKLEANLAKAMLSIPASKGFEIGKGFESAKMRGSIHNDPFSTETTGRIVTKTNFAGGTLGGISTGMPLQLKVAFKPASSISMPQKTLSLDKEEELFALPEGSRHDPCVAIRAVPVVESMTALVLVDALLLNRASRL